MPTRPTARILARRLLRLKKAAGSWRALQEQYFPQIPNGTLCRIAITMGEYLPRRLDYRQALGLPPMPCPTCHKRVTYPVQIKRWHSIQDLKPDELRYVIEHREEVMA